MKEHINKLGFEETKVMERLICLHDSTGCDLEVWKRDSELIIFGQKGGESIKNAKLLIRIENSNDGICDSETRNEIISQAFKNAMAGKGLQLMTNEMLSGVF